MADFYRETVEGLLSSVYDYCGNPPEDKLSPSQVLTALFDRIQHYRNELNLTDEGWSIERTIINAQSDKEEYLIEAPDFGRPFFVETFESGKPQFRRREVEMARPQDRNLFSGISNESNYSNKHSARVFIFFNIGQPNPTAEIIPVPRQSCQYRVWHESIFTGDPSMAEVPMFMRHFFNLLRVSACMDVLGFCDYEEQKFNQIWGARMRAEEQYHEVFWNYVQQMFHEDAGPFRAANSSRRRGAR